MRELNVLFEQSWNNLKEVLLYGYLTDSQIFKYFSQGCSKSRRETRVKKKQKTKEQSAHRAPNALLTQRKCSYLMLIIKAGFEHGRRFCYFPTPLEPSPCDSPPLHPGKLSAWAAANKNSPVRGMWGPASAPLLWWGDTSLCISSSPPKPIIYKRGEQDHSAERRQRKRQGRDKGKEKQL